MNANTEFCDMRNQTLQKIQNRDITIRRFN